MMRKRNRLLTLLSPVIFCIVTSTSLWAQDHKHPPIGPSSKPDGQQSATLSSMAISVADLEQLALQHNPTLAQAALQVEAARGKAYHAADQSPLEPADLAGRDSVTLPALRFVCHPSVSVVCSIHPVVTIWAMNAGEAELAPIEKWEAEDALVVRPHLTVQIQRLPPGGAKFLTTLMSGATLGAAVEAAFGAASEFDLATNLAGVLQSGALTAIA